MASTSRTEQKKEGCSLTDLPFDVVGKIMAKVDVNYSKDLFKYKTCCKFMMAVVESGDVYRELDIDGITAVPFYSWVVLDKKEATLKKCKEFGNLNLMYRDGTFDFFRDDINPKLRLAGEKGQRDAIFTIGMLMMVEGMHKKNEA